MKHIDIVCDGPPGPEAGRFVEVEDDTGCSIRLGEWIQRSDGYWVLRFPDFRAINAELLAALELARPHVEAIASHDAENGFEPTSAEDLQAVDAAIVRAKADHS